MGECVTAVIARSLVHTTDLARCREDDRSSAQKAASLILKQGLVVPLAKVVAKSIFTASLTATGGIIVPTLLVAGVYITAGAIPDALCYLFGLH